MTKKRSTLTDVGIRKLTTPGRYADGGGLYIQVGPTGGKSWSFRYMLNGKSRQMGLGAYPTVTLAEARFAAQECRKQTHQGFDPIAERDAAQDIQKREAARSITFKEAAAKYIEIHRPSWKNPKHADQWANTFRDYVHPTFGDVSVASVTMDHVLAALNDIWTDKTETATRVRGRIECVLDWASSNKMRQGENPARWKGVLQYHLPAADKVKKKTHFPALPFKDMAAFMKALRQQAGTAARGLEFCILTAARTSETLGAKWEEFDLDESIWTIPGNRMKARKDHRVALSGAAVNLIKGMSKTKLNDYVFPGGKKDKPLSNMAFLKLLERMGRDDITTHGFRSTFKDWATETTEFSSELSEMALAHAVSNKVEAAYRRGDLLAKRFALMEAWASHCAGATTSDADEVVADDSPPDRSTQIPEDPTND